MLSNKHLVLDTSDDFSVCVCNQSNRQCIRKLVNHPAIELNSVAEQSTPSHTAPPPPSPPPTITLTLLRIDTDLVTVVRSTATTG